MELNTIVPWGRNMAEYKAMFSLNKVDFEGSILGCGDGPASFNAEATRAGCQVTSIDPIYAFDRLAIQKRIAEVRPTIMDQLRQKPDDFVWTSIDSPDQLETIRLAAMAEFLDDFDKGLAEGRYLPGSAPDLPFDDAAFDLALCSHFLFLYSQQFGYNEHLQTVRSLARVAKEVRLFPLNDMHDNKTSVHLSPIIQTLSEEGYSVKIVPVAYEFMRGATDMLVIKAGH